MIYDYGGGGDGGGSSSEGIVSGNACGSGAVGEEALNESEVGCMHDR